MQTARDGYLHDQLRLLCRTPRLQFTMDLRYNLIAVPDQSEVLNLKSGNELEKKHVVVH